VTPSDAEILREVNWVKNTLKHHDHCDAMNVNFNAKLSAFLVLKRAIENVRRLGLVPTQSIHEFEMETKQYGGD
jgi:predicted Mrr-cat superfamily restriction endonuclease